MQEVEELIIRNTALLLVDFQAVSPGEKGIQECLELTGILWLKKKKKKDKRLEQTLHRGGCPNSKNIQKYIRNHTAGRDGNLYNHSGNLFGNIY